MYHYQLGGRSDILQRAHCRIEVSDQHVVSQLVYIKHSAHLDHDYGDTEIL